MYLDKSFCGRVIDETFLTDLPPNVDPCGENGEFHSFVFEAPIFDKPIPFIKGDIVYRKYNAPANDEGKAAYGFYFFDLLPAFDFRSGSGTD
jgi:diphthamide synthase (EF-2-diphthine--ammonia ligase)